jgi:hypothetical protein
LRRALVRAFSIDNFLDGCSSNALKRCLGTGTPVCLLLRVEVVLGDVPSTLGTCVFHRECPELSSGLGSSIALLGGAFEN